MINLNRWKHEQLIVLKQKQGEQFKPSENEIEEYALQIGINLPQQSYLLPLAQAGLTEPVPQNWQAVCTPDDQILYRNKDTKQLIDEHPCDELYRQMVIDARTKMEQQSQQSSYEESVIQQELSEIAEEQNQMKNQSQIYERGRYDFGHQKQNLRGHLTKDAVKVLDELKQKQHQQNVTINSALDRNISHPFDDQSQDHKKSYSKNLLPSSLLRQENRTVLPIHLDQLEECNTEQIVRQKKIKIKSKESENQNNLNWSKSNSREEYVQKLKNQLNQLLKQQVLKKELLLRLQQQNSSKILKMRRKMKHGNR